MVILHNIVVKRHNTIDEILILLLSNKKEQFTIRAISQKTKIDYKTTYLAVQDLIKQKIINAKKAGQTTLCSINKNIFNSDIFRAEMLRKERLLKSKDISVLHDYIKDIGEQFFILLIFGSRTTGKSKGSDMDLMLITDNEKIKKQMKDTLKLIPLDTHLNSFNSKEFISMLKTTDFNVGNEAADNNIILFGIEDYYRLVHHN